MCMLLLARTCQRKNQVGKDNYEMRLVWMSHVKKSQKRPGHFLKLYLCICSIMFSRLCVMIDSALAGRICENRSPSIEKNGGFGVCICCLIPATMWNTKLPACMHATIYESCFLEGFTREDKRMERHGFSNLCMFTHLRFMSNMFIYFSFNIHVPTWRCTGRRRWRR